MRQPHGCAVRRVRYAANAHAVPTWVLPRKVSDACTLPGCGGARIGKQVGHDDLVTTARTWHVVADERELDYQRLLRSALPEGESVPVIGQREAPGRR
jgi:hypothetical protein